MQTTLTQSELGYIVEDEFGWCAPLDDTTVPLVRQQRSAAEAIDLALRLED